MSQNSITKNMGIWKTGLYIRLSKEDGAEVSYSILNQQAKLLDFIDENKPEFEIYDTYIDDGFSGTDTERDAFQKMLIDIESKNINCVIVKDLSRLSRNDWESGYYLQYYFVEKGIRFISLDLPRLDSYLHPEEVYSLNTSFQALMNDNHCRETSIKIRSVFNTKRKKGEFIGSFAPYGYTKDASNNGKLVIDCSAAQVVRDIFSWFVHEGMTIGAIARKLNRLGIPNPSLYKKQTGLNYKNPQSNKNDGLWSATTVSRLLKNQVFIGSMVQGKQKVKSYKVHTQVRVPQNEWFVVENTHEPIISNETFDIAQTMLTRNMRISPEKSEVHLFAGLLFCSDCGKAMVRNTVKDTVYYHCRTYREKSKDKCTKHTIKLNELEEAVLGSIRMQVALVADLGGLVDQINSLTDKNFKSNRLESLLAEHKRNYENKNNILANLYLDYKSGELNSEQYKRVKEKLENEIISLEEKQVKVKKELEEMQNGFELSHSYFKRFLQNKNIEQLERALLIELIDKIIVHEGKTIEIVFSYQDQYLLLLDFISENKENLRLSRNKK